MSPASITLHCIQCGSAVSRHPSYQRYLSNNRGVLKVFCGRACKNEAQRVSIDIDAIRVEYESGMTLAQVGAKHQVSWATIRNKLAGAGVTLRKGYRFTSATSPTRGVGHTEATKAKLRAANLRQFSDDAARERHSIITCQQIEDGRTGRRSSSLESIVARRLSSFGVSYIHQYRVGRFVFDFYIPNGNLLIEAHGTFWHADPRIYDHGNLYPIQRKNVDNDRRKARIATDRGYSLIVVWELDAESW